MRERILIYGAGGHAKTVISLLRLLDYDISGIVDDAVPAGTLITGVPVIGGAELLPRLPDEGTTAAVNAVGGIGNVDVRLRIFDRLKSAGFRFPTLIHPTAFVEDSVQLADGIQILAQSYISSGSEVGFGTLINAGVIVSHDGHIGQVVNLSPGALLAGNVTLEDYCQVGIGATVNLGLHVGTRARIGNNATVKADVPDGERVYAGCVWPEFKRK